MRVRFWGTRGSIAKPGRETLRYGGNTSCVEVRTARGALLVLDCGTGAHDLGRALVAGSSSPVRGHLLISHTHWDHIQGMPFFAPLFVPGNEWDVYAPRGLSRHVRDTLAGQMQYTYFPVSLEELPATVRYHELVEGEFAIEGARVVARYLNHPALDLGYRIEADGASLVYATDHEPHSDQLAAGADLAARPDALSSHREDRRHAAFVAGADLLVHDAQYTAAEYAEKAGWGHSTLESVIATALAGGVRRLALFHHDPLRDDDGVDALVEAARSRVAASGSTLEVFAAAEGQEIELQDVGAARPGPPPARGLDPDPEPSAEPAGPLLLAVADAASADVLGAAVRQERIPLLVAHDGEQALGVARRERPALLLADRHLPAVDGLALCRALRAEADERLRDLPVVLVADARDAGDMALAFDAGATDWLTRPFSDEYARARIRAWLLRTECRWRRAEVPAAEARRLAALRGLGILDTPREERFDRLTRLAARLLDVPIALISLVDEQRQWFKSCHGASAAETHRDQSFCAHAILRPDGLVVGDALTEASFADNPAVAGPLHIRFYAGYPLRTEDGSAVGTLCVLDHRPRQLDDADLTALRDIAALAEEELLRAARR